MGSASRCSEALPGRASGPELLELRLPAEIGGDSLLEALDVRVEGGTRPWSCRSFSRSQFFSKGWELVVTDRGDDATCSPLRDLYMSEEHGMFGVAFLGVSLSHFTCALV